jgi:two-component system, NtrC family, response regulator
VPPGWIRCSADALLFAEGSERWSTEGRAAAAAAVLLRREHANLKRLAEIEEAAPARAAGEADDGIVGTSPAIRELLARVALVARRDVAVCIVGESGSGKELIARAVHRASSRRSRSFVAVNCAALPENLIESELFGSSRGAFTSADRDRPGLIESADGGTLFLDEIGEMPLPAQAKLLRFLQEGEFRRVGEAVNRTADVRIIAATNRELEEAVDEGSFREDLYYRIAGVDLRVPPLRERGRDSLLIAGELLAAERARHRGGPALFSPEVEAVIVSYGWPGNVRELQNTVRAAHALAGDARQIELEHLPDRLRAVVVVRKPHGSFFEEVAQYRRTLIERSLAHSGGNQNQAARLLGMSRQSLAYQIRELGILVR